MGALGKEICDRCYTTHPLNEQGERPCPKPPIQRDDDDAWAPAIIWKCGGATKGYRGGKGTSIPNMDAIVPNPGHSPPTLGTLGLSAEQGVSLGIK